MTPPAQSFFSESVERSAQHQQLQMWRAAQTVRAQVTVADGQVSMLDCLGLTDAKRPEGL